MKKIEKVLIIGAIVILTFYIAHQFAFKNRIEKSMNDYIEKTSILTENDSITEDEIDTDTEISKKNGLLTKTIDYKAVLEIPNIDLKEGLVDSTANFNSINYAISIDKNSNYPDKMGNFILYAHSGNSSIAFFKNLYKVNEDDKVYVYYNGIKYEYIITNKYDVEKSGKVDVITTNSEKYITLITCNQSRKGYQTVFVGKINNEVNY